MRTSVLWPRTSPGVIGAWESARLVTEGRGVPAHLGMADLPPASLSPRAVRVGCLACVRFVSREQSMAEDLSGRRTTCVNCGVAYLAYGAGVLSGLRVRLHGDTSAAWPGAKSIGRVLVAQRRMPSGGGRFQFAGKGRADSAPDANVRGPVVQLHRAALAHAGK